MTELTALERALGRVAGELGARGRHFALVGGLAVSARAEPRFTRDVDLAVTVTDDADTEQLVLFLSALGYRPVATVEHDVRKRLATVRLLSPEGVKVDLLTASSGIEPEVVARASAIDLEGLGPVPVATAEDLLALKVLSMTEQRLQDRIDAERILQVCRELNLEQVRERLSLITARGYHRDQDLSAKLDTLVARVREES